MGQLPSGKPSDSVYRAVAGVEFNLFGLDEQHARRLWIFEQWVVSARWCLQVRLQSEKESWWYGDSFGYW